MCTSGLCSSCSSAVNALTYACVTTIKCGSSLCVPGYLDCDNNPSNGCETKYAYIPPPPFRVAANFFSSAIDCCLGSCSANGACQPSPQTSPLPYNCTCKSGFSGNGVVCTGMHISE